jgi:hypothetical protein
MSEETRRLGLNNIRMSAYGAAASPIVAAMDGEGARVVMEAVAGVSYFPEDPQALGSALRMFMAMAPAERQQMVACGRRYFEAHFEPRTLALQLRARLERAERERGTDTSRQAGGAE